MARDRRLSPGSIAQVLYGLDPDRDERAPQLCAETLLTLSQNGYQAPALDAPLKSPKRRRFAVRSLALGENFLGGDDSRGRAGDDHTSPAGYGQALAEGKEVRGSANLVLAHAALEGLVDPDTHHRHPGGGLQRPFHESLLWYDARKPSPRRPDYTVRKVYMRGSGITLARMLLDPQDPVAAELGRRAVAAIEHALTAPSPLSTISERLESALSGVDDYMTAPGLEKDEQDAWDQGGRDQLQGLAGRLCRHAEGVMGQGGASGPARLWQLRTVLALDLASHTLRTAWDVTGAPSTERYLLLSFGGATRAQDPVRQRSEESYRRARIRLGEATVRTLARRMRELNTKEGGVAWELEFEPRSGLAGAASDTISSRLAALSSDSLDEEYLRLARMAVENANYGRAEDGFRVLLQSVGLLGGTRYPFLTASTDLLAALVGALSADMPMASHDFFAAVRQEWGIVINQEAATGTTVSGQVDGAALERNARRAEQLMSQAGLALSLSDRTTVVGERAAREHP